MAYESYVLVCGGTACCSGGGDKIVAAFAKAKRSEYHYSTSGCLAGPSRREIIWLLIQVKALVASYSPLLGECAI